MRKETAHKLYNRLNNQLQETLEVLGTLQSIVESVDTYQDFTTASNELDKFEKEKDTIISEMTKLQSSF